MKSIFIATISHSENKKMTKIFKNRENAECFYSMCIEIIKENFPQEFKDFIVDTRPYLKDWNFYIKQFPHTYASLVEKEFTMWTKDVAEFRELIKN